MDPSAAAGGRYSSVRFLLQTLVTSSEKKGVWQLTVPGSHLLLLARLLPCAGSQRPEDATTETPLSPFLHSPGLVGKKLVFVNSWLCVKYLLVCGNDGYFLPFFYFSALIL